ncbi:alpha/beta hydrolase family protein [Streptomyces sp. CG 926]|uniref:alpha/beta fold hydrolase n=1 Tax=Streptomyces sp. CG 926 TaxID=1882405 RepID=UPI000D6B5E3D|nr:alpha/beta fold hydrolase [Streptomyces sp. CG 926]PWK69520.1 alpha/beta hydrolase family protein [Streptomyces sp. CG 926]
MTAGTERDTESTDQGRALVLRTSPTTPAAAVLLLHGGREEGPEPPPPLNLPALRMRPFAAAVARATRGHDVLVAEVRYRHRGWNGSRCDAARDAEAALARLRSLTGDVPVVLVGHSMGGRAALRVAGAPLVHGVVALAPWCPPGEPVDHLAGRRLYLLHDEEDRVTSAAGSWDFVRRSRLAGADATGIPMPTGGHAMLRGAGAWHRRTAALVAGLVAGD